MDVVGGSFNLGEGMGFWSFGHRNFSIIGWFVAVYYALVCRTVICDHGYNKNNIYSVQVTNLIRESWLIC